MKIFFTLLFATAFFAAGAQTQTRYLVRFRNKGTNPYSLSNPSQFLSARAIQRRTRYNIALDSTDLPVTPRYVDSVRLAGAVTIISVSKWINEVAIRTTDAAALAKINALPFVLSATPVAAFGATHPVNKIMDGANGAQPTIASSFTAGVQSDFFNYGLSHGQVHLNRAEFLHNHGFRGEGMQMTLCDGGFFHYLSLPTFDSVRANNQILTTYDFVANETSVDEDDSHGMECLSTIAANLPGVFVGTAPKASFCLFRTEDVSSESRIEEHNLSCGFERADSAGTDVCSVSLGYNQFDYPNQDYTYADMNGNTTMSAIAADLAAKKGMLPVVAAGNEGQSTWHYITTPGDADSALTVGAVDTLGNIAGFSSYGPSSDGQVKPNLSATGLNAVIANPSNGQPTYGSGTSFATPNLAGMTTCLWQAFPEFNNMTVLDAMQRAASRFTNPGAQIGYGIPDMKKAFVILQNKSYNRSTSQANCAVTLSLNVKFDNSMSVALERKASGASNYTTAQTVAGSGSFANKPVVFVDDISGAGGTSINYRIRIDIGSDTTYYADSVLVNFPAKPALGVDQTISDCSGNAFNLQPVFNSGTATTTWTLNGTPVANPQAVTVSGDYRLIATNSIGCSDTAVVSLQLINKLNIGADQTISKCNSDAVDLTQVFNTSGLTTNWSTTNPTAITDAGTYRLIVSNNSGCIDTANVIVVNDPSKCPANGVSINPNPVADVANISVSRTASSKIEIIMVNESGQRVFAQSYTQAPGVFITRIPMQGMSGGTYFVSVFADGKKFATLRLIKK